MANNGVGIGKEFKDSGQNAVGAAARGPLNRAPTEKERAFFEFRKGINEYFKSGGRSTPTHEQLRDAILDKDIVFAVGSAGTGKTYTSAMIAAAALKSGLSKRIIVTRPAVEAGEKLGFLPGDQKQKLDPYMAPIYDAFNEIIGTTALKRYEGSGEIEVAPIAFMRGRTFTDSFIIFDESQNATKEQFYMVLTRLGLGSKMIITGDPYQADLEVGRSGLAPALEILKSVPAIEIVRFTEVDNMRHPAVADITTAFRKASEQESAPTTPAGHGPRTRREHTSELA